MLTAQRTIGFLAIVSSIATSDPALAENDAAKTGLIAALGIEAASGKTTIAGGAGAIEAGLLSSDAMLRAGAIIASITNEAAGSGNVLVMSRDQQVSLAMVRVVQDRIQAVRDLLGRTPCPPPPAPPPPPKAGEQQTFIRITPSAVTPYLSDIAGAIATDTTIAPVAFTTDDRMLVNAVLMGRSEVRYRAAMAWQPVTGSEPKTSKPSTTASFIVPNEIADVTASSPIRTAYDGMQREANAKRGCSGDAVKGAISAADALTNSLNAAEKGAQSPLVTAMQLDGFAAAYAKAGGPATYILRIAIEQTGGTAITRSGIIYTVGFPGASVVSAGVLVSFRLVMPQTGAIIRSGVVRCAVPQTRFGKVQRVVLDNTDRAACSYRAS